MGLVVVVLGLWGLMVLAVYNALTCRERENKINILIEAAMNNVSTIVLRLLFIVKISGLSICLDPRFSLRFTFAFIIC